MTTVDIPTRDGWTTITLNDPRPVAPPRGAFTSRVALAAAHVVADPREDASSGSPAAVDWDSTLAFRRHLIEHGLGVAEAMDTAQRGMGLEWSTAQELIRRSADQARAMGGAIASGAGTDHAPEARTLDAVVRAYRQQVAFVEEAGSQVILMASRQLAATARNADDYLDVYDRVLTEVSRPVILHWLGEAFDPALAGYWGSADVAIASDTVIDLVRTHPGSVDGIKVSLLSSESETALRRRLPDGIRLYTGDDFHYPELIRGDGERHSDALLGAFAAIAPAASAALAALDRGDTVAFDAELEPTLPLARHLFEAPTPRYKAGIAFLSWLNGFQPGFTMLGGLQSARSALHLARVFELADQARLLTDPDRAAHRLTSYLAVQGLTR